MSASPLGKYGDIAAAIVALAVILAALAAHVFPGALHVTDTGFLDNAALLVLGVVLGQRSTTNGAAKIAMAAHLRLDAIHAPAANDGAGPSA